jgi:hypothetical protein
MIILEGIYPKFTLLFNNLHQDVLQINGIDTGCELTLISD